MSLRRQLIGENSFYLEILNNNIIGYKSLKNELFLSLSLSALSLPLSLSPASSLSYSLSFFLSLFLFITAILMRKAPLLYLKTYCPNGIGREVGR